MKTVIAGIVGVLALAGVASAQEYMRVDSIECIGYTDGTSHLKVTFQDGYTFGYWNGCSRPTNAPAVNGGFNDVPWPATTPANHGAVKKMQLTLWTSSEKRRAIRTMCP